MNWLWTWSGQFFGYRDEDNLWTYKGFHVGRFEGNEIYGPDGQYLGEIMNERLITNCGKKSWRRGRFNPYAKRGAYSAYSNYVGYAMYAGHEDFPKMELWS